MRGGGRKGLKGMADLECQSVRIVEIGAVFSDRDDVTS